MLWNVESWLRRKLEIRKLPLEKMIRNRWQGSPLKTKDTRITKQTYLSSIQSALKILEQKNKK